MALPSKLRLDEHTVSAPKHGVVDFDKPQLSKNIAVKAPGEMSAFIDLSNSPGPDDFSEWPQSDHVSAFPKWVVTINHATSMSLNQ